MSIRLGKLLACVACGQVEVAGQYKSAPKKPDAAPPLRPASELVGKGSPGAQGGAAKAPEPTKVPAAAPKEPTGPDALAALPGVTGLGRVKVGISWGLPGFSSVRVDIEDAAREGENLEELADRISIMVWQRLVKEGIRVMTAVKEPERYLNGFPAEHGEPVGEGSG